MGTTFFDNGAHRIKATRTPPSQSPVVPYTAPNALVRTTTSLPPNTRGSSKRPGSHLIASELDHLPDLSGLSFRRPHDRGFVSLWDSQKYIWNSVLSEDVGIGPVGDGDSLVVTEHIAPPIHVRRAMDELCFSMFDSYAYVTPQQLAASKMSLRTCLVLDSGFSFTTAVPIVNGVPHALAVRRLSAGGKILTNYLKEMITFRSWNMMQETAIINAVKQRLCYVSLDYEKELLAAKKKTIAKHYVLPDLSCTNADPCGHVLPESELQNIDESDQILIMNNERISIPEILFNPSDIGINQAGVPELIFQSAQAAPEDFRADLYANIVLIGGNCRFPNFAKRVEMELRPMVDSIYDIRIFMDDDPHLTAFWGGVGLLGDEQATKEQLNFVTKDQYNELGSDALLRQLYNDEMDVA